MSHKVGNFQKKKLKANLVVWKYWKADNFLEMLIEIKVTNKESLEWKKGHIAWYREWNVIGITWWVLWE